MWRAQDLSALAYLAGWKVVGIAPEPVARVAFRFIADRVSHDGKGMEQLRRNLTRVVGAENVTRQLVRDSMRSYLRYWLEAFRLPRMHNDPQLLRRLHEGLIGLEHLRASERRGKGVILALPHSGNWDMAGTLLVDLSGQFTTVAERLKPEVLFDAFVDFRRALGFDVVALTGGAESPFHHLKQVVEAGGIVCLLSERDLTRTGVSVDFMGEQANMAAGPAQLAIETGAALHIVHSWYESPEEGGGWGLSVSEPVEVTDVVATTQRLADGFAANIRRHPADWHMLQPQWNVDVDKRRRAREAHS
ncbi:phosphatidylinositol mannoside acyltransferase [Corynebacterium flavescens]